MPVHANVDDSYFPKPFDITVLSEIFTKPYSTIPYHAKQTLIVPATNNAQPNHTKPAKQCLPKILLNMNRKINFSSSCELVLETYNPQWKTLDF